MTNNDYLGSLLEEQKISEEEKKLLKEHRNEVENVLRNAFGSEPIIKFTGSKAKHTMIKENYDLDIVCYFPSTNNNTLKELHDNVQNVLSKKYSVLPKASAVRILNLENNISNEEYHIDVVPGCFIDETNHDAFLHVIYGDRERIKTNIKTHIEYISESGCRDLIKLTKLWVCRNKLPFKTFVLELFVVNILSDFEEKDNYEVAFKEVLQKLSEQIDTINLADPANSNNIVTQTMSDAEKFVIKGRAVGDLEKINKNGDLKTFGDVFRDQNIDEILSIDTESRAISIPPQEDLSHWEGPSWPIAISQCEVSIRCFIVDEDDNNLEEILSDEKTLFGENYLRYEAVVKNFPVGAEIYWQVVNTGIDARKQGGLRGDFFKGKDWKNRLLSNEKINYEFTRYTGKHWIECFMVNQGLLIARSGRFFIKVMNKKFNKFQPRQPYYKFKKPSYPKGMKNFFL